MKFDYLKATVWGKDGHGPDGVDLLSKPLELLKSELGGEWKEEYPLYGYASAMQLVRDEQRLVRVFMSGSGGSEGSTCFQSESMAHEVYPVLHRMFPRKGIARVDAAEDFSGAGTWQRLVAMLTSIAGRYGVSMRPEGEGHIRPDGTRDATRGRTWYFGSRKSVFQICLYEKGLQQLALGIPADPTWVRIEARAMPTSKNKHVLGQMDLSPIDVFAMSKWGKEVADYMGASDLARINIGSVWRPSSTDDLAMKVVRMFDTTLDELLQQCGTHQAVTDLLWKTKNRYRLSRQQLALVN